MNYYESQARQNLQEIKEIAQYNGTWESISNEHEEIKSTMESMYVLDDDEFIDVYNQTCHLKNRI